MTRQYAQVASSVWQEAQLTVLISSDVTYTTDPNEDAA